MTLTTMMMPHHRRWCSSERRERDSLTSVDIRITHLSLASLLLCQSLTSERLLCCDQEPEQTVHRPRDPHMKDPDDDDDEDEDEKEDEEAARW